MTGLFAERPQVRQHLAHFSRSMEVALAASFLDALAQHGARLVDAAESNKLLSAHEERRNVRRRLLGERSQAVQTLVVASFFLELQGEAIAQEPVVRVLGEHRLDLFAPCRHRDTVSVKKRKESGADAGGQGA